MNWVLAVLDQNTLVALIITAISLTIAMAAEMAWPRRALTSSLSWRWSNNLGLALITWYVTRLANYAVVLGMASWAEVQRFGLFQQFASGFWLPLLCLIAVLQFCSYLTHLAFHHVPWLWRLHAIHHSDVDVDISTSYRHHPLEPLVFLPLLTPAVVLLGIPVDVALAYQIISIFLTIFTHCNVRLPPWLERILNKVLVTPDFHRIHHSSDQRFTNSNYGNLVPWFDYLFGTAKYRGFAEHESFELGLEYHRSPTSNRLDKMILIPFSRAKVVTGTPSES